MASRAKKIPDDVTAPDQVVPTASSRPTVTGKVKAGRDPLLSADTQPLTAPLVRNRHMLEDGPIDMEKTVPVVVSVRKSHVRDTDQANTDDDGFRPLAIGPVLSGTDDSQDKTNGTEILPVTPVSEPADMRPPASKTVTETVAAATENSAPDDSEATDSPSKNENETDSAGHTNAVTTNGQNEAERLKTVARLVADETYFVPVNAVARRRSRIVTMLLLLLALVLLVALADLLLDTGIIRADLPQTRFF